MSIEPRADDDLYAESEGPGPAAAPEGPVPLNHANAIAPLDGRL
jgi:hypothetical protein